MGPCGIRPKSDVTATVVAARLAEEVGKVELGGEEQTPESEGKREQMGAS